MIDINKPSYGVDYTIQQITTPEVWYATVLRGPHTGIDIRFTNISYDGNNNTISFMSRYSNEDGDIIQADKSLEDFAGYMIEDILKNSLANGEVVLHDKDTSQ